MMELVRHWIFGVAAAAIIVAIADSLMPAGPIKRVGKLVCGLVLLTVVISPLNLLNPSAGVGWLEDYFSSIESSESSLKNQSQAQLKAVIEKQFAAYIVDKATEMGAKCQAEVTCQLRDDGTLRPIQVKITGIPEGTVRDQLSDLLEEELEISKDSQIYVPKEETP